MKTQKTIQTENVYTADGRYIKKCFSDEIKGSEYIAKYPNLSLYSLPTFISSSIAGRVENNQFAGGISADLTSTMTGLLVRMIFGIARQKNIEPNEIIKKAKKIIEKYEKIETVEDLKINDFFSDIQRELKIDFTHRKNGIGINFKI